LRAIARGLHRAISTVSQELARHGGREGYRAAHADQVAWDSARRPKPCVLATSPPLQRIVAGKLKQDWSPQQIAGWLRDQYPESPEMWVSHETIYRSLFVQARGALKKELIGHLRSSRSIRRPRMPLTGVWARGFSMHSRKKFRTVDRRSLKLLKAYGWPANVRELRT